MNEHSTALVNQAQVIRRQAEYLQSKARHSAAAIVNEDPKVFHDIRAALRQIEYNLNALKARFGE